MKKLCFIAALCAALLLVGCKDEVIPRAYTGFYFDTYVTFTIYSADGSHSDREITDSCKNILGELEEQLTSYGDNGVIAKINDSAANQPVSVDENTFSLLEKCIEISQKTDGAFDITLGEISRLWGFGSAQEVTSPNFDKIESLAGKHNYKNITLNSENMTVQFTEDGFSLDLGAAAKGYALGLLKDEMLRLGVKSAVIDFGGNIQTIGDAFPGAQSWGVSVTADDTNTPIGKLNVGETCISTSNASRRYVEYNGKRYHHIIDPMTGYPAQSDIKSVTVISSDGTSSDAYSTAFFVMGSEKALSLCEKLSGIDAVITLNDGSVLLSDGAEKIFTK